MWKDFEVTIRDENGDPIWKEFEVTLRDESGDPHIDGDGKPLKIIALLVPRVLLTKSDERGEMKRAVVVVLMKN